VFNICEFREKVLLNFLIFFQLLFFGDKIQKPRLGKKETKISKKFRNCLLFLILLSVLFSDFDRVIVVTPGGQLGFWRIFCVVREKSSNFDSTHR
jgi:hypothetical protein